MLIFDTSKESYLIKIKKIPLRFFFSVGENFYFGSWLNGHPGLIVKFVSFNFL